jgi:hypothetical protein
MVIAVVYLDTSLPDVLNDDILLGEISEAVGGFAAYIEERFSQR